ncbi:hypothetical protein [Mollivirus kamchatka]|nr:hypothetical protein [Mollivirus kamchatka]
MISDSDDAEAYERHVDTDRPCDELARDLSRAAQSDLDRLKDILSQNAWTSVSVELCHRPWLLGRRFAKHQLDALEAHFVQASPTATDGITLVFENFENNQNRNFHRIVIRGQDLAIGSKIVFVLSQLMSLVQERDATALLQFARYFGHLNKIHGFPASEIYDIDNQTASLAYVPEALDMASRTAFAAAQHLQGKKRQVQAMPDRSLLSPFKWIARVMASFCIDPRFLAELNQILDSRPRPVDSPLAWPLRQCAICAGRLLDSDSEDTVQS